MGRSAAHTFDRLFIAYSVLLILSLGTFIWTFVARSSYTSRVCCGDFIDPLTISEEAKIIMHWDIEGEFYLISSGKLMDWFIGVETVFFFFCLCSTAIWTTIKQSPFRRVATTVDSTQAHQQQIILQDRIAFKMQI